MSSHPGKSYPHFRLAISEEPIYNQTAKDKLFGYAVEAPRGPINEPTYVASSEEAYKIFGIDFAPHFYQKPTGLVITRVGLPNATPASITYCIKTTTTTTNEETSETTESVSYAETLRITTVDKGQTDITVRIIESIGVSGGYTLIVDIPGVISKTYRTLKTIKDIAKTINNKLASYLKAEHVVDSATNIPVNTLSDSQELVVLKAGKTVENNANNFITLNENTGTMNGGSFGQLFKEDVTLEQIENAKQLDGTYDSSVLSDTALSGYQLYTGADSDFQDNSSTVKNSITMTAYIVYKKAFDLMAHIDLVGVATLSELDVVQSALEQHIQECLEPEIDNSFSVDAYNLRFAVTAFLDYNNPKKQNFTLEDVQSPVFDIDSEYFIYIGQGVKFKREDDSVAYDLPPHKAVMLYTGIRSSLDYDIAIFGGEDKKILKGVVDVLPIVKGTTLYKDDREELNENGVTTFKREYDRVTFLEGVTTIQDSDVLSYENIMSIVVYITKRLIKVAKEYQGKKMTEDLKESLKTALTSELRTIQQTDGCLVPIKYDEYDIPAYSVEVESAAMLKFNDAGELIRQSKMVAKCKIVPIGALRDIDLGVIVI